MFSLRISAVQVSENVRVAASSPSMTALATIREPADPAQPLTLVIEECPEFVQAFDRGVTAGAAARAQPNALERDEPHVPRSPTEISRLYPPHYSANDVDVTLRWSSQTVVVVLARHRDAMWSGVTVAAVHMNDAAASTTQHQFPSLWASPGTSLHPSPWCWATHVSPPMLRRFCLHGLKQGLLLPRLEEETESASFFSAASAESQRTTMTSTVAPQCKDEESADDLVASQIWSLEDDLVRGGVWLQLAQVLACVQFVHIGNGLFAMEVCQRIPMNDNLLTSENGYRLPRWACAQRLVFVLDDEYREVKIWSTNAASAICLMNISLAAQPTVDALFCSADGGLLFLVNALGLRILSTHQVRDVLQPAFQPSSEGRPFSGKGADCVRTFCGDQLQDEQSARIAWDTVGRNTSTNKLQLLRADPPHDLLGIQPADVRRVAVVEDCISVVCKSGRALLLTPWGECRDDTNLFPTGPEPSSSSDSPSRRDLCDDAHQHRSRSGVVLHVGRPPLPAHVVDLILHTGSATRGGCTAWFASASIHRDSLLRNEIRFEVSSIAFRLCALNDWDASHVQDTTLQIALQDSPEQVYLSLEDVFYRETSSATAHSSSLSSFATPSRTVSLSPAASWRRSVNASLNVHVRPVSTMQLLCRLVSFVCSRFDHCPDDVNARSTLRALVVSAIRATSLLLQQRCSCLAQTSSGAAELSRHLAHAASLELRPLTIPSPSQGSEVADSELAAADVYFLLSLHAGLQEALQNIPDGTPIVVKVAELHWAPRAVVTGFLGAPAVATANGGGAGAAAPSGKAWQRPLVAQVPQTWSSLLAFVSELLCSPSGIARILATLKDMVPVTAPTLLEYIAAACRLDSSGSDKSVATRDLNVVIQPLWQLSHLQCMVGYCAVEAIREATAAGRLLPELVAAQSSTEHVTLRAIQRADTMLCRVYGQRGAAEWWALMHRRSSKHAVRDGIEVCGKLRSGRCQHRQRPGRDSSVAPFSLVASYFQFLRDLYTDSVGEGERSFARAIGSRVLYSHGAFLIGGGSGKGSGAKAANHSGATPAAMAHNASFLLVGEECAGSDGDASDGDDVRDTAMREQRAYHRIVGVPFRTVTVSCADVDDVSSPPGTKSERITLQALAMLKPTQPVPYVDIAIDWVFDEAAASLTSAVMPPTSIEESANVSLLGDDENVWLASAFELALARLRDAQGTLSFGLVERLSELFRRELAPALDSSSSFAPLRTMLRYCFRHHDMEAFLRLVREIAATRGQDDDDLASAPETRLQEVSASLAVTARQLAEEDRVFPENASLHATHRAFLRAAASALHRFTWLRRLRRPRAVDRPTPGTAVAEVDILSIGVLRVARQQACADQDPGDLVQCVFRALADTHPLTATAMSIEMMRRFPDIAAWQALSVESIIGNSRGTRSGYGSRANLQRALTVFELFRKALSVAELATVSRMLAYVEAAALVAAASSQWDSQSTAGADAASSSPIANAMTPSPPNPTLSPLQQLQQLRHRHPSSLVHCHPLLPLFLSTSYIRESALHASPHLLSAASEELRNASALISSLGSAESAPDSDTVLKRKLAECIQLFVGPNASVSRLFITSDADASDSAGGRRLIFPGRGAGSEAAAQTCSLGVKAVERYLGFVPQTTDDTVALLSEMMAWQCVAPVVATGEADDSVRVDVWALLLDGRPITAYFRWTERPVTLAERRTTIAAARTVGLHFGRKRPDLQCAVAAFLRLIDVSEFQRFLMDCTVIHRLDQVETLPIQTRLAYAKQLASFQPFRDGESLLLQHEASTFRTILQLLGSAQQPAAGDDTGFQDTQDVRGMLLQTHFVKTYIGTAEARHFFLERIACPLAEKGDWVWAVFVGWAAGLPAVDWMLNQSLRSVAPALMHILRPATVGDGCDDPLPACDTDDFLPPSSTSDADGVHPTPAISSVAGREHAATASAIASALLARPPSSSPTAKTHVNDSVPCVSSVVALLHENPVLAFFDYMAANCSSLGVVSCAKRCAESIRAGNEYHLHESLAEVAIAVMQSRNREVCVCTREMLVALIRPTSGSDPVRALDDDSVSIVRGTLIFLDVHQALLESNVSVAKLVIRNGFASLKRDRATNAAQVDQRLCDVAAIFVQVLASIHIWGSQESGSALTPDDCDTTADRDGFDDYPEQDGEAANADEFDDGNEDHLHSDFLSTMGVMVELIQRSNHPARTSYLVAWFSVSMKLIDGHAKTATSSRARHTATAVVCCKPLLLQLRGVLANPRSDQSTSASVMLACLNRHPNLTPERLQELAVVVEGVQQGGGRTTDSRGFVDALRLIDEAVFSSGLFSCPHERHFALQAGYEEALAVVNDPTMALNALGHSILAHIANEDISVAFCSTVVSVAVDLEGLSKSSMENLSCCDTFLKCVESNVAEAPPSSSLTTSSSTTQLPPVILRILLGTIAEPDDARERAEVATREAPSQTLSRTNLLPPSIQSAVSPAARHRTVFRAWLRRHYGAEVALGDGSPNPHGLGHGSPPRGIDDDPIGYIEDYVPADLIDEARALALAGQSIPSGSSAQKVEWHAAETTLLWRATSTVLCRCMREDGIDQLLSFLAAHPSDPLSAQHCMASISRLVTQCVEGVLRAHYVPLMHDIAQRIFSRERAKYPTALADFEQALGMFFFADTAPSSNGGGHNLFGLGEASGWVCKARIHAICRLLVSLQPLVDAYVESHAARWGPTTASSGTANTDALLGQRSLVTAFGMGIVAEMNAFQSFVKLPHRALYPRVFLEPLVLTVIHGFWILQAHYDEQLASAISKELACLINVCSMDGDYEPVRKIVFSVRDVLLLEFVVNVLPISQLVTLANSSPDFQLELLHRSTMRIAIMSLFDALSRREEFVRQSHIEMTTLYANFRHFTSLGERLEQEAHHMLQTFVQQQATQKKGLLDSKTDALRRQNRMLDEIDARFLSAANFFIQDGQFERCLACIRDLHLISVQRKSASLKILGLSVEQAVQLMTSTLELPQDIVAVGYGYNVTSFNDWAAVLYRQVLQKGRREVLTAYRQQTVSFPPVLRARMTELWKADSVSQKDSAKRQLWAWIEEEVLRAPAGTKA